MSNRIKFFEAAGITIKVISEFGITENTFLPKFKQFEVKTARDDNVTIAHHFSSYDFPTESDGLIKLFSNKQWQIFKTSDSWIYQFEPVLPGEPGCPVTVKASPDHTQLNVYPFKIDKQAYQNGRHNALTLFNSDQVLFSKLLCDRDGLILHSNGFAYHGNGFLLAGRSGAGKSTLSRMLKHRNVNILCDDRMFVKKEGPGFHIYGSWCHGSVPDAAPLSAPLKAVFFLNQSNQNRIERITDGNITRQELIQSLVKPFLGGNDWVRTLETLNKIVRHTKCYNIFFDLSGRICSEIKKLMKNDPY